MSVLLAEDRSFGNIALQAWYEGGPFKPYTLTEARDYYDSIDPDFIAQLGHDTKSLDQSAMRNALAALANSMGSNYPTRQDFYGGLASYGVTAPSLGAIAGAARDGIAQAVDVTSNVVKTLIPLGIIAIILLYGPELMKGGKSLGRALKKATR